VVEQNVRYFPGRLRSAAPAGPLTDLLNAHIAEFGFAPDGRLFRAHHGGMLSDKIYGDIWRAARTAALTPDEAASQLAKRSYDLRQPATSSVSRPSPKPDLLPHAPSDHGNFVAYSP
jgi:hypothetical protein